MFNLSDLVVIDTMSAKDIDQWTSLSHVLLISELEKKYKIKFALNDMLDIQTVDDLCKKILELTGTS